MKARGFSLSVVANQDLSPSIALKRKRLAVDLTVSPACAGEKCFNFSRLYVPETIAAKALAGIRVVSHSSSYLLWVPLGEDQRADRVSVELRRRGIAVQQPMRSRRRPMFLTP